MSGDKLHGLQLTDAIGRLRSRYPRRRIVRAVGDFDLLTCGHLVASAGPVYDPWKATVRHRKHASCYQCARRQEERR
jgi:hypothetical protein